MTCCSPTDGGAAPIGRLHKRCRSLKAVSDGSEAALVFWEEETNQRQTALVNIAGNRAGKQSWQTELENNSLGKLRWIDQVKD